MKRTLISILLLCSAFPFWAKTERISMSSIEFDRWKSVKPFLCCEVNETDTVWTLEIWGGFLDEDAILLLKTMDNKVLELQPEQHRLFQETDSLTKSPLTGEWIEHYHYECILEYRLTSTALHYFMTYGVAKMRIGTESRWKEKVWKKDELGKNMTQAYRIIMERLSPDYVPPKKKTIYDDF